MIDVERAEFEARAVELLHRGLTRSQAAKALRSSWSRVSKLAARKGIVATEDKKRWTEEQDAALADGIAAGRSKDALASELGRTLNAIDARVVMLGGLRFMLDKEHAVDTPAPGGHSKTDPWQAWASANRRLCRQHPATR